MFRQSEMHDSALIGRHGFQSYRASGVRHATCNSTGHVFQRLVPALLVPFDIYHQVDALVELVANDVSNQELERLKGLTLATDKQACVIAFDLENRPVKVFVVELLEGQHDIRVQVIDERLNYVRRNGHAIRRGFNGGYPDYSRLGPYSENPGLASANDVYFYVGAICV